MSNGEKRICSAILREGELLSHRELKSVEGVKIDEYKVKCDGEIYWLVKNDGEWVNCSR